MKTFLRPAIAIFVVFAASAPVVTRAQDTVVKSDVVVRFDWRLPQSKPQLIASGGGSPESESAVARGLKWIVQQQQKEDGGWSFGGGATTSRNAATGLVVLSLLGAGQTPHHGAYKEQVAAGIRFLRDRGRPTHQGTDYGEPGGSMYAHGIATWALVEAYAMTGDAETQQAAKRALDYLLYAQDPLGGGWRYQAQQPGDMSVTGWQLSVLNAAKLAGFEIPQKTLTTAEKFVRSVEDINGKGFGYVSSAVGKATTAEGVLGRIYLSSEPIALDKQLDAFYETLLATGPRADNSYFRFFATQAMFYRGGDSWAKWNQEFRDHLIDTQDKADGADLGSWPSANDQYAANLGRLYTTTLSVLTLEVYYRYQRKLKI